MCKGNWLPRHDPQTLQTIKNRSEISPVLWAAGHGCSRYSARPTGPVTICPQAQSRGAPASHARNMPAEVHSALPSLPPASPSSQLPDADAGGDWHDGCDGPHHSHMLLRKETASPADGSQSPPFLPVSPCPAPPGLRSERFRPPSPSECAKRGRQRGRNEKEPSVQGSGAGLGRALGPRPALCCLAVCPGPVWRKRKDP